MSLNVFEDNIKILRDLGKEAGIEQFTLDVISAPENLFVVNFPIKMDDGSVQVFTGYRSRYSTLLGPAKGGIRFHKNVDDQVVNGLALAMMVKNSLAGLPYGGGKGGVKVDTSKLSNNEIERVARGYAKAISKYIGPYIDIPAPDVATNGKIMAFMLDEYEKSEQQKTPALITGKPIELGGSVFRVEATGFGVFITTDLFVSKLGKNPKDVKISIQGFGNVGSFLAKYLYEKGYQIIGLSDVKGGIYSSKGIDVNKIIENLANSNVKNASIIDSEVSGYDSEIKIVSNEDILELDVDVLIPAAIENVIRKDNVDKIKAKYIVEAANEPITSEADEILEKNGVVIVPGVLANSGGVIVSYFEWVQNLQFYSWDSEKVQSELIKILEKNFNNVWDLSQSKNKSLRSASYYIALKRLEEAVKLKLNM